MHSTLNPEHTRHLAGIFDARADHDGIALVQEAQSEEALQDLNALFEIRYPLPLYSRFRS